MSRSISLFVPGRLCLFGEHSDWAGMYRTVNSALVPGAAIVTGVEQGIYGTAEKSDHFEISSDLELFHDESFSCPMDDKMLLDVAQEGGFFSYVAGVASYINENYVVGGVKIIITQMDLPIKSGLSSSAAICVLVARAFNRLYNLQMNIKGEMQAAFRGEQRTPSRCGRLDQACAYGVKPVLMKFDGLEIDSRELQVGATMHWVIANLMGSKDTIKILGDLNKCYPFAQTKIDQSVQQAFGPDNQSVIQRAKAFLEAGDTQGLGALMNEAQANFDKKVMPACDELIAPILHDVLKDPFIRQLTYGGKGVGSQGDGTVQFIAKDAECARKLMDYLESERGMPTFSLTLHPGQTVKRAIIPLAGFGTRVFPATKCMKKCFLPILDRDGILKPALLIMLEELEQAGIEEVCLVIGEEDQDEFRAFFGPLPQENYDKLPSDKKKVLKEIRGFGEKITYIIQKERAGFGHAVWLCKKFTQDEPVLLMLGDFLYRSRTDKNCCKQVMEAFVERGKTLVSIQEVPLNMVVHYGILAGEWENSDESIMKVDKMYEKPTSDYAKEYLGVSNRRGEKKYYATFGQYILTKDVFEELEALIKKGKNDGEEFQLTSALEAVREGIGMDAFVPDGDCFDIGLPETYYKAFTEFGKNPI